MDENKEYVNIENMISDTDITDDENEVVDIADMGAYAPRQSQQSQQPQKSKPVIMKPILVAAGIVLVVALAVIVIRLFFNSSVEGTWHYVREVPMMAADATSDEAVESVKVDYYFTFEGNDKVTATIGTITSKGTYEITKNAEGKSAISMTLTDLITSYNFLPYGEYDLSVSGNAFTGRKLVMFTSQDESATIEMESASYTAPEITRENEFTVKEDIVGTRTSVSALDEHRTAALIAYDLRSFHLVLAREDLHARESFRFRYVRRHEHRHREKLLHQRLYAPSVRQIRTARRDHNRVEHDVLCIVRS